MNMISRNATTETSLRNPYIRLSLLGLVCSVALLIGPLDSLADGNLTVHMFQHIGLFVSAVVFGYGIERYLSTHLVQLRKRFFLGYRTLLSVIKFNTKTRGLILAGVIPAIVFFYWHLPSNFDLAVLNDNVHVLEHVSYIIIGSIVGLSIVAIPSKIRIVLVEFGFMQAGMMGSMMVVWPYFYTAYSAAQNSQMDTAIMLFGAFGVLITSTWMIKILEIF
jgi:cytochrome c oxidase assembly factor CtaG